MHSILLGGSDYEIGDGLEYPYREYRGNALTKTAAPDSRLPRPNSVRQRRSRAGASFRGTLSAVRIEPTTVMVGSRSGLCPSSRRVALCLLPSSERISAAVRA